MTVDRAVVGTDPFGGVLLVPVLMDCAGNFHQPTSIFGEFENIHDGKKLDAIRRRIAQRF